MKIRDLSQTLVNRIVELCFSQEADGTWQDVIDNPDRRDEYIEDILNHDVEDISKMFIWGNTEEGGVYWYEISKEGEEELIEIEI